jgi:hypothetical protein
MSIAAVVGAERLREIMAELVNRASVIVQRYGANVDQFTGDGIMAVFGAPVALEDHAFRACLAALEIQKEVQGLAADIDRRDGVELRLRIGLNFAASDARPKRAKSCSTDRSLRLSRRRLRRIRICRVPEGHRHLARSSITTAETVSGDSRCWPNSATCALSSVTR